MGSEIAAVDIGCTLVATRRGGNDDATVTRSVDGIGVIYGADEVVTVCRRVSHRRSRRGSDLEVFVAWSGRGGDDATGEMGVSSPGVIGIIFIEADTELLDGGVTATVIPVVFFRVDDALIIGEIAAVVWIG